MKKLVALCVFALLVLSVSQAFANLDDNRASMAVKYGDYRLVIDKSGHLWTKADWEGGGSAKAKAGAYVYYFTRNGLSMQMEVQYEGDKPDSRVTIQRITPGSGIQIKEFKDYFPEVYTLTVDPKAQSLHHEKGVDPQLQGQTLVGDAGGLPQRDSRRENPAQHPDGLQCRRPGRTDHRPQEHQQRLLHSGVHHREGYPDGERRNRRGGPQLANNQRPPVLTPAKPEGTVPLKDSSFSV